MLAGLALATSADAAPAAELGQGQGRSARDLRFDRELKREHPATGCFLSRRGATKGHPTR